MSSIKENLKILLISSQKAKESKKVAVLRQISAAIKQFEIDNKVEADDLEITKLFAKLIKQRNESITQFKKADRKDLIAQEKYEIEIIQQFLPPPIEDSELQNLIQEAINKVSATSAKDIGKVLGTIKPQIIGRADMAKVSSIIKESLNS